MYTPAILTQRRLYPHSTGDTHTSKMHTQYASTDAILATQSLDIDTPTAHDSRTGSIRHAHGPQYSHGGGRPLAIQQIHVRAGYTAQRYTHNTPS